MIGIDPGMPMHAYIYTCCIQMQGKIYFSMEGSDKDSALWMAWMSVPYLGSQTPGPLQRQQLGKKKFLTVSCS